MTLNILHRFIDISLNTVHCTSKNFSIHSHSTGWTVNLTHFKSKINAAKIINVFCMKNGILNFANETLYTRSADCDRKWIIKMVVWCKINNINGVYSVSLFQIYTRCNYMIVTAHNKIFNRHTIHKFVRRKKKFNHNNKSIALIGHLVIYFPFAVRLIA